MKIQLFKQLRTMRTQQPIAKTERTKKRFTIIRPLMTPATYEVLALIVLSGIIAFLTAPQSSTPRYEYNPGDIAQDNIRAHQDFTVEDTGNTEKRRREKMDGVPSVYDFNAKAENDVAQRITAAFGTMRDASRKKTRNQPLLEKERLALQALLRIEIDEQNFALLADRAFKKELEEALLDLVLPFSQREVVASKGLLFKERGRGIILRNIASNQEIAVGDFTSFIDVQDAEILLRRDARTFFKNEPRDIRKALTDIAVKLIEPTITYNAQETRERRKSAAEEVAPLFYSIQKNEIIVREGTPVGEVALLKLNAMRELKQSKSMQWTLLGYFLFSLVSLMVMYRFAKNNLSDISITRITYRDFIFLCLILLMAFLLFKFCAAGASTFAKGYTAIPLTSYYYGFPFAFAAIVISIVLSPQIASLSAVIVSLFAGFLLDNSFVFFSFSFISAIVATQEVRYTRQRSAIIRAGIIVATVNALLVLSLYLITGDAFKIETVYSMAFGMVGGVLSAVLATGIIPIIEIIFNYTTDIKLLELADLNQPVLHELLIAAPGTYHHSILVGVLAEAAAEAINADPLLARVCAYYHDIGKIKKPLYFVENQKGGENKHDRLTPSMSSLIITTHVKDGIEIARQHRIGRIIQDIIAQHHGTSIITYFYQKAREMQDDDQPVSDKDFRYPGPKPQTKEAGIVMLADAVQATSKTLTDPSPSRIQGMVQRIINNIFVDGQLDECELKLKDLHLIAESFNRILNGIFHARIDYPVHTDKEGNGKDTDKKPAKSDADRSSPDKEDGERDLGRLGIVKGRGKHSAAG
jgi:cyclic-di-AMP phosphodiesterase PgpH